MKAINSPSIVTTQAPHRAVRRRSFLQGIGMVGAAPLFLNASNKTGLSSGDNAILRFLAAAEIIETDLWQQYNELGGVNGRNPAYILALENLDADMPQYITDNTDDELSHATFLNAYLQANGGQPVNLNPFRTLPSSKATGARQVGRLTNLQQLNVDTSWYLRYRSSKNPDLSATFGQPLHIPDEPAIPISDADTPPNMPQPVPPVTRQQRRMQAIANTAGFHFGTIEQGGSSLYASMSAKATNLEVLRIIVSIGGVEVYHFAIWHDKAGNAVSQPLAGVVDPETGVTFPDFNSAGFPPEMYQTNKIMPEPTQFLSASYPLCSVIRPSSTPLAGAVATVAFFTNMQLFAGQSTQFFDTVMALAVAADAAQRGS